MNFKLTVHNNDINIKCEKDIKLTEIIYNKDRSDMIGEIDENSKELLDLMKEALVAKVVYKNGDSKLLDISLIEISEDVESVILYDFNTKEGKHAFWHSSAHILGHALVNLFGAKLVNGPAIEEGFYYDIDVSEPVSEKDFTKIEKEYLRLCKLNSKFVRKEVNLDYLKKLYEGNDCKLHFVNKSDNFTVYKNMVKDECVFEDFCRGPHINSSGMVKAVKITKNSSCYFLDKSDNKMLQRIYGVSFPNKKLLSEYKERILRAKEMDHRKIGREMNLFFFNETSPGSCFWLPDGAYIYNKLQDFIRNEYKVRGFKEVITPNIYSLNLWKESGHYENYKENIFMINSDDFGLKPMNCPGHCIMFKNFVSSYKELPLRLADFGVLHRNECSGSLSGLTRVRRFQQDDAHIFCMSSQIKDEIKASLDFLKFVYDVFNFRYELLLSTRPEKFIGEITDWDIAEENLKEAIIESGHKFILNEGDGAFYGPKIDIILYDAFQRKTQCATIQLDFQLPQRFNLQYQDSDGELKVPVIIHRAIYGSLERFIAIILESYGKKLPFWLSPRQIGLVVISEEVADYAKELKNVLIDYKIREYSDHKLTLNKKIRTAEIDGCRLICVIGRNEKILREVNLRNSGKNVSYKIEEFKEICLKMTKDKKSVNF